MGVNSTALIYETRKGGLTDVKKLDAVLRAIDTLSEKTGQLFSWSIVLVVFFVLYEVVMRTAFNRSTVWVFELDCMLWGAYLVMIVAWTQKEGGHIRIDVLYNLYPARWKLITDIVLSLALCFTGIAAVVYGGIEMARQAWANHQHSISLWAQPLYPFKTTLAVGYGLLGLQCLAQFIRDIRNLIGLSRGKG